MKTHLASWGGFFLGAAAALGTAIADSGGEFWYRQQEVVGSCNDYEGMQVVTAEGVLTFLGPLLCDKSLVFHSYNDTVMRSHDDAINTTNVHFIVHPGATLTVSARVTEMPRDEVSTQPVLKVLGNVKFEARAWTPSYVHGANAPHEEELTVKMPPLLGANPKIFQGRPTGNHDVPETNITTSTWIDISSSGSSEDGGGSSRRRSSSSSSRNSGSEDAEDTHVDSGDEAARKISKKRQLLKSLSLEKRATKRMLHVFGKVKRKQDIKNNVVSNLFKGSVSRHANNKRSTFCPRDPWMRRPTCALHVGETPTGTLGSAEERSALWSGIDGSHRFGEAYPAPSSADNGRAGGSEPEALQPTTLLSSDPTKAREALGMRRRARSEENSEETVSGNKNIYTTMGGWSPWTQRAKTNRSDKDEASNKKTGTVGGWLPMARRGTNRTSDGLAEAPAKSQEV